ncbi:hypothetical protein HER32_00260 [Hymenobacter sp. BT18]|uniref:hypothetical protein n=1 Tax=Hymenobacter sp. BT18 TaxID=2835648 RepID=UPI00143EB9C9|nr:hypothetical protein [Hymenobacter sp. BT18]QIX59708.1 hypothetical protein HER32_00260 [Hymenobacter sp. BT18]
MNNIDFKNSVAINVPLNGSAQQAIGNQSTLDGKKIKAIIARATNSTDAFLTSTNVAVAQNLNGGVYLQITSKNNVVLHDAIPLYLLDPTANGTGQILSLDSQEIDWTKTRIIWGDPAKAQENKGKELPLVVVY